MLANIIAWAPNSETLSYSRIYKNERRIYMYDINDETSYPTRFPSASKWFEVEFIHPEQLLIHDWEKGFFIYDIEEKHTQLILNEDSARSFSFNTEKKELIVSSKNDAYLFSPKTRSKKKLSSNLQEFIIDDVQKTFITIDQSLTLSIYFKNESIFSHELCCGIYLSEDSTELYYFTDSHFYVLDLNSLEILLKHDISGSFQCANIAENLFQFTTENNDNYSIYIFNRNTKHVNLVKSISHKNQLFTSISPNEKSIALASDLEHDTIISIIPVEEVI